MQTKVDMQLGWNEAAVPQCPDADAGSNGDTEERFVVELLLMT